MRDRLIIVVVTIVVTDAVLQIVPDVLGYKRSERPVKIFFLANNAMHVPIAYGLYVLAAAETQRQIGAF